MSEQNNGGAVIGAFLGAVASLPLRAWLLMLVLGAVHGVVVVVPAVGFGTAILFVIGLNLMSSYVRKMLHPAK